MSALSANHCFQFPSTLKSSMLLKNVHKLIAWVLLQHKNILKKLLAEKKKTLSMSVTITCQF